IRSRLDNQLVILGSGTAEMESWAGWVVGSVRCVKETGGISSKTCFKFPDQVLKILFFEILK
ncbi:hypothetical protein, partial [Neisseria meningitidis]|uniref:hypothetical protein n=1 Tax=Neisseria meningitidis TaxID=487 RepID=UPI000FEF42D9